MNRTTLRIAVGTVALVGLVGPIVTGLWETFFAALGTLPGTGGVAISVAGFAALIAEPGFGTSLWLTVFTGVFATLLSLVIAAALAVALHRRGAARFIAPVLAVPHAALAIGLAFVLAPSGWVARLISPWATGWAVPPDVATVNDPAGLALIVGLVIKEVPFLMLVMLAALGQVPVARHEAAARALGYEIPVIWAAVILPQVYRLIRLPLFVVLSFSLSVVDMAMILGPTTPPTLAVAMTRWFMSPHDTAIMAASAAAIILAGVVAVSIVAWLLAERVVAAMGRWWLRRGARSGWPTAAVRLGAFAGFVLAVLAMMALAVLAVWSLAWRWPFPAPLPTEWSARPWVEARGWGAALGTTALIAALATVAALTLAVAWLEGEGRARARWAEALIYLPLIVPQIAFLYGLNVTALRAGVSGDLVAVIWVHAIYVFPYVMIALSDPWRGFDPALERAAAALGAGPWRRLVCVKLPILARPILTALAIGLAVSVAQYLPTLFLGAGRIVTLTTEAVTLASGADRRITGVYAALQAGLPLIAYAAALILPGVIWRNRAGLAGAGK